MLQQHPLLLMPPAVTTHEFTNFALTTLDQSWQKHVSLSSAV